MDDKLLKLHLACGKHLLDGWVNVDISAVNRKVIRIKLPSGLKRFKTASARYIYTSHFLEHLDYPQAALFFVKECYRILIKGGVLRVVIPGIERIIKAYVSDDTRFFKVQEGLHPPHCTTKFEHLMYALQNDGQHKYGYDFETLRKLFLMAGFDRAAESDYNQSDFAELRVDYRGEGLSLFAEAYR